MFEVINENESSIGLLLYLHFNLDWKDLELRLANLNFWPDILIQSSGRAVVLERTDETVALCHRHSGRQAHVRLDTTSQTRTQYRQYLEIHQIICSFYIIFFFFQPTIQNLQFFQFRPDAIISQLIHLSTDKWEFKLATIWIIHHFK